MDLKYKSAVEYYKKKEYYKSGTLFEEIMPLMRGQSEAEQAQFYYAYSQYHQGQLVLSAYYFKKFYETYPRSTLAEEAYYMHCISLYDDSPDYELDQTNTLSALQAFQEFIEKFPGSERIEKCNRLMDDLNVKLETKAYKLAKLYVRTREYKSAVVALDNVIKDFPSSSYVDECAYLRIVSQYEYAKISIESKQKERFQAAIDIYYNFVDKYPESKYLKAAESTYEQINVALAQLENPEKIAWYRKIWR